MTRPLLIAIIVVGSAVPLQANICASDQVPAATLLFPFVVFDYNQPWGGETTLLSITNVHHKAQVVRVVLWTDLGMPVLEFNVLLSGYDIQRFNIRDILLSGNLPVTVAENHASLEGVASSGPVSAGSEIHRRWISGIMEEPNSTNAMWRRCDEEQGGYPGHYAEPIPDAALDLLRWQLTASQRTWISASDDCEEPFENPYVDPRAWWLSDRDETSSTWMYVTADVVETCRATSVLDETYWKPAVDGGEARFVNVLTGDAIWVSAERSMAMPAVHIEADQDLDEVAVVNPETALPISFYARYANPLAQLSDDREPLPTAWSFRYMGAHRGHVDTRVLAWKASTNSVTPPDMSFVLDDLEPAEIVASNCMAYTYYSWDEEENVITFMTSGSGPCTLGSGPGSSDICPNLLPLVVQEIPIDQFDFVDENGWMLFVWPAANYPEDLDTPPAPDFYQTWMGVRMTAWDNHATFLPATNMANSNCFANQQLPRLGVDFDYVTEEGYVSSGEAK